MNCCSPSTKRLLLVEHYLSEISKNVSNNNNVIFLRTVVTLIFLELVLSSIGMVLTQLFLPFPWNLVIIAFLIHIIYFIDYILSSTKDAVQTPLNEEQINKKDMKTGIHLYFLVNPHTRRFYKIISFMSFLILLFSISLVLAFSTNSMLLLGALVLAWSIYCGTKYYLIILISNEAIINLLEDIDRLNENKADKT